ncbi:hypothetical protein [Saccharopolyspora sp. CA-218241]|uniref:hypothetical protein n=1 Tax=Saccharopolyspora sp. CA-218241 TaxID=3240027 RepID=UPI003D97F4AA
MVWSAVVLLALAAPVAFWYVIGDQSSVSPDHADYLVEPLRLPSWVNGAVVAVTALVVLGCALVLLRESRRGRLGRRHGVVLGLLLVAGLLIGVSARMITAGVIGANIGGGIMLMVALPLAGALVLVALGYGVVSTIRRRSSEG